MISYLEIFMFNNYVVSVLVQYTARVYNSKVVIFARLMLNYINIQ